jgi:hypothetical protein
MAEANVVEAPALESAKEVEAPVEAPKVSLDEALKKLADYEAEAKKNEELLKKLRKFEKENAAKAEKEALEAGKYKELYDAAQQKLQDVETRVRNQAIEGALKDALTEAKAKALNTALKLVDVSKVVVNEDGTVDAKSVAQVIKDLKGTDPLVFDGGESAQAVAGINDVKTVVVPALHKAGEGATKDAFQSELAAAKSLDQVKRLYQKYQGKI